MNILAGDIGGTKTLLGIYNFERKEKLVYKKRYISNQWDNFYLIIKDFINSLPQGLDLPIIGCIGVAGFISNGSVKVTNLLWEINTTELQKISGCNKIILLNDFSCIAYSIPFLQSNQFESINSLVKNTFIANEKISFAVIGAGTGLGITRGFINNNSLEVFPSEGGHREFAARSEKEWEISQWIKRYLKLSRLSIERFVSGTGLGNIARWRLSKQDTKNHPINKRLLKNPIFSDLPQKVFELSLEGDPIMKEVVEIWLSAYGSIAGDLFLQELCNGGIWLAGGTAKKHLNGFRSETFLKAFKEKGRFSQLIERQPIMALIDPEAGLFGAACKGYLLSNKNHMECENYLYK